MQLEEQQGTPPTTQAADPANAPTPPPPTAPSPPAATEPKTIVVPTKAMANIKREERDKGRKAAQQELEDRARKAGFASAQEMEEFAMKARRSAQTAPAPRAANPQQPTTPAPAGAVPDRQLRRLERERERALEEVKKANRLRAAEEKRRKDAERQVVSLQAEMELRTAAVKAGVVDIDYAITLLHRHAKDKTPEERRAFDENKYFAEELRKSHPHLYGVVERPVHTAPQTQQQAPKGSPTTMPHAGPPPQNPANGNTPDPGAPTDARRLSREEYDKLKARLGISRSVI